MWRGRDCLRRSLWWGLKTEKMSVRYAHLSFCFPHLVRVNSSHLLQTKCPAVGGDIFSVLRRGRDSNPRYGCPHNGFRDRHNRPLCHLSVRGAARGAGGRSSCPYADRRAGGGDAKIILFGGKFMNYPGLTGNPDRTGGAIREAGGVTRRGWGRSVSEARAGPPARSHRSACKVAPGG